MNVKINLSSNCTIMMFKKTIFSLALALISVMSAHAQNADECIIDAILNGVPDGTEMEAVPLLPIVTRNLSLKVW